MAISLALFHFLRSFCCSHSFGKHVPGAFCGAVAPHHPHHKKKPMLIAKVEKPKDPFCACMDKPKCGCAAHKPKTVAPEIKKENPCLCAKKAGPCGCRMVKDACGCLHLKECPCRNEFVEPETKEPHLEPELTEKKHAPCGCVSEPVCACRPKTVTPEIKEPPCPCGDKPAASCACTSLKSN